MKISSLGKKENLFLANEKGLKNVNEQDNFAKTLSHVGRKDYHQDLQKLITEVDKMAEKLAKSCTLNGLKNYKRAVQNFLKRTLGMAYEAQDEASWDHLGRQKVYILVKKVDEKLEEISHEVLKDQGNSLNILDKLDEIRGLLIDMYL